ncbi:MAM domain-containing protein 2-like [Tubulanus polymorphus]|uniref:MAM domain-containing protein 2-like n=1 Tax=Tubulanus polymorphus TaxID=672921 RepID=UPI003DA56219
MGSWKSLNFELKFGTTRTWFSGPDPGDHTIGDWRGHYVYMEASYMPEGCIGTLENSLTIKDGWSCSMNFWYHMYGSTMGSLEVFLNDNKVFEESGDKGNYWNVRNIPLPAGLIKILYGSEFTK